MPEIMTATQLIHAAAGSPPYPADVVLTPFLGIGSEAYVALKLGRRAVGIELKESYFRAAVRNLEAAVAERGQATLFELEAAD
jgi:tRNA G10  N-methylase Trm11